MNHWSDKKTTKEHFDKIVAPALERGRKDLDLPPDYPGVVIIDCWSVHLSTDIREWVARHHPTIRLLFVPPNCTGRMQPCDLAGQKELKWALRALGTMYASAQVQDCMELLERELDEAELEGEEREQQRQKKIGEGCIKINTSISALKPYLGDWHLAAFKCLQEKGIFLKGWERSRLLEPWDPAKADLLFKLAVERNENGTLWTGAAAGAGGEHVPEPLIKVLVATGVEKDAEGQPVVQTEQRFVHEPRESETDIAEEERLRERAATYAREVR